ncbi:MAG: DUF1592 domain-containing protein [Acidobacteria bacterium]|nr:DUF1592 domain-containing protein [Acidobacteriota bacterium]
MLKRLSALLLTPGLLWFARAADPDPAHLLTRYCAGCHNDRLKSGQVSVTGLRADAIPSGAATWEKILRKVRTGEMPPPGLPRPAAEDAARFTNWLETSLDRAGAARPQPGAPPAHRLNRAEYSNAIRDLLGLDFDHASSLPPDDAGYGFDNIGEVLTVSPAHFERYMATARRVSRLAVGTFRTSAAIERYNARGAAAEATESLPLNQRGTITVERYFPSDAEYAVVVRVRGNPAANMPPPKLDVRVDGRREKLFDVVISQAEEAQNTRNYEFRRKFTAGMHTLGAGFLNDYSKVENGVVARRLFAPPPPTPASVDYVTIAGPFNPTGPGDTESRRRVFICRPGPGVTEPACAGRIIGRLARLAYRRPVTAGDTAPLMKLFAAGRSESGSFEGGIETALRAILVSPGFLFRVESNPAPGTKRKVTELELASRLSFFLWSSIPDDRLLRLAGTGKLRASLEAEVRRMLADPRAKALADNFAGQWLHLRNVSGWRPDPDKYQQFDEPLRTAFQRETELFFEHIVRQDRSAIDFIAADYTFLNERLARHYGIPGVRGPYYRRVQLQTPERGGVMTHGSILTVTSYPTRTSPVLRGKWILENILGSPPPPPPPDVPDLEDKAAASAKDLRAALEKHRANPACASCHARLDPMGFALENYDAIGKFRAEEGGHQIDASSQLPGGAPFRGATGLRTVLLERKDQFIECLAEKLLTYALGRGLEHPDFPVVREIRRQGAAREYRFSALALAVVNSVPFQMREGVAPASLAASTSPFKR